MNVANLCRFILLLTLTAPPLLSGCGAKGPLEPPAAQAATGGGR